MTLTGKRKKQIYRRALLAAVILGLSLIQNTAGGLLKIGGVGPLLLIPAVVAAAMYEGDIAGIFYGLFAGALWDVFAKGNNFNAIFLVATGFACGMLILTVMRVNFVTHLLLSSCASGLYCIGYWFFHFITPHIDRAFITLLVFYLPMAIFTSVLSPLVFLLIRAIEIKFRTEQYTE